VPPALADQINLLSASMTDPFTQVESVDQKQDIENSRISDAHKSGRKMRLRSNGTSSGISGRFNSLYQYHGK
jgi:hypothetical protein